MYKVDLSPGAREFYASAQSPLAKKIARGLEQLETEPRRHNNIKSLKVASPARGATALATTGSSTRSTTPPVWCRSWLSSTAGRHMSRPTARELIR